jgi:predicted small integral membrane protein
LPNRPVAPFATVAWTVDHAVFGSVFVALSAVAVFGAAAPRHWR